MGSMRPVWDVLHCMRQKALVNGSEHAAIAAASVVVFMFSKRLIVNSLTCYDKKGTRHGGRHC